MKNLTLKGVKLVTLCCHPNNAVEEREPPLPPALVVAGWVAISRTDPATAGAQT